MTRNKILFIFLFMALSHSMFAGSNCDSLIANVLNVFKLKHNYEASVMYQQKKETISPNFIESSLKIDSLYKIIVEEPTVSLKKYMEKITSITLNKSAYKSCIESELAIKNNDLKMPFTYDYLFPLDSHIPIEGTMKRHDYLKVFMHFIIDLDYYTLPPLKVALEYLKNN